MKKIPLTKGFMAVVDDEDYEFLMQWKWHALIGPTNIYAERCERPHGKKIKHILMHRVINKIPKGLDTDHRDGNGLHNWRKNLRNSTRSQNMQNRRPNKIGTSKYKGVYWHIQHEKWCASIQINKKRVHLGLFTKEDDAACAYAARAKIEFNDFNREHKYG